MKGKKIFALVLSWLMGLVVMTGCSGKPKNVEEYLKQDGVMDEVKDELGDTEELDIYGEDNTLVYTYTFAEYMDLSDPVMKELVVSTLEESMQDQSSVFEDIADQFKEEVQDQDVVVRVEYINSDGEPIYTCEFK